MELDQILASIPPDLLTAGVLVDFFLLLLAGKAMARR